MKHLLFVVSQIAHCFGLSKKCLVYGRQMVKHCGPWSIKFQIKLDGTLDENWARLSMDQPTWNISCSSGSTFPSKKIVLTFLVVKKLFGVSKTEGQASGSMGSIKFQIKKLKSDETLDESGTRCPIDLSPTVLLTHVAPFLPTSYCSPFQLSTKLFGVRRRDVKHCGPWDIQFRINLRTLIWLKMGGGRRPPVHSLDRRFRSTGHLEFCTRCMSVVSRERVFLHFNCSCTVFIALYYTSALLFVVRSLLRFRLLMLLLRCCFFFIHRHGHNFPSHLHVHPFSSSVLSFVSLLPVTRVLRLLLLSTPLSAPDSSRIEQMNDIIDRFFCGRRSSFTDRLTLCVFCLSDSSVCWCRGRGLLD